MGAASRQSRLPRRNEGSAVPLSGGHIQLDPGWRMVAGVLLPSHPTVHACLLQTRGQVPPEHQMLDAQAGILLPVPAKIVPEGVDALLGVEGAHRIGPALGEQTSIALAALWLQ